MADRGFTIENDFKGLKVDLNIPSFLGGRVQLMAAEIKESQTIASVMIHVERSRELTLLVLTGGKNNLPPLIFIYLPNHWYNHPEIFHVYFFISFGRENLKLENFPFRKFYWSHPFSK